MRKRLNKIVFALLISIITFNIVFYLSQEIALLHETTSINIEIKSSTKDSLYISYNFPLIYPNAKRINFEVDTTYTIKDIPLESKRSENAIFFGTRLSSKLFIKKIKVINSFRAIDYELKDVLSNFQLTNLTFISKEGGVYLDNNEIRVEYDSEYPFLKINSIFLKQISEDLLKPFKILALIISSLVFLIIVIFCSKIKLIPQSITSEYLTVLTFLSVLFSIFFTHKTYENYENRRLEEMPSLNQNIWRIPSKYNQFYIDHFPYRVQTTSYYNLLKYLVFDVSSNPKLVESGKNDFLFFADDKVRNIYQGRIIYTEDELKLIKENLEKKAQLLKLKNIEFYLIIPPLKHTIYPELLPGRLALYSKTTKRSQLMNYLKINSNLKVIDPLETILKLKDSTRVYYKSDTHWNQLTGFKVYQQIIKEIKVDFPILESPKLLSDYTVTERRDYEGDLVKLINIKDYFYRDLYLMSPNYSKISGKLKIEPPLLNEERFNYFESTDSTKTLRLLMYRDSFGGYLYKHLSEHFAYSGFSISKKMNQERILKEKPDILIFEMMERYIDELLVE